jgi:peptidoglycan/xylan/chitin deacetylase (PgdA/CDA1 family)
MSIESHSWDHNHVTLDTVVQRDQLKGDFRYIDNFEDCCVQLEKSAEYIEKISGVRPSYFAYPWGKASDYLLNHYMPEYKHRHQYRAAFSCFPKPVSREDNRWFLPRYICGHDWKSPEELSRILTP